MLQYWSTTASASQLKHTTRNTQHTNIRVARDPNPLKLDNPQRPMVLSPNDHNPLFYSMLLTYLFTCTITESMSDSTRLDWTGLTFRLALRGDLSLRQLIRRPQLGIDFPPKTLLVRARYEGIGVYKHLSTTSHHALHQHLTGGGLELHVHELVSE